MKEIKSMMIFLFFTSCLIFLYSCGGGSPSGLERAVNLSVAWTAKGINPAFSKYEEMITSRAALFSAGGGADGQLTDYVKGKADDEGYLFLFSDIQAGDYVLRADFYYVGTKIGSASVPVSFGGDEAGIFLDISSGDIVPADANATIEGIITSIAPLELDMDGDGLTDKYERKIGTDPLNADTDGDGLPDGVEVEFGLNPLANDTDGDGYGDKDDAFPLDANEWADTDKDGVGDNKDNCVNASNSDQLDTDADGIGDACSNDDDGDGLSDADEAKYKTDPKNPDTDGDGLPDGVEVSQGTNPLAKDTDGDGYGDRDDAFPLNAGEWADTDRDGVGDNSDNCLNVSNPDQRNTDLEYFNLGIKTPAGDDAAADDLGDACDDDIDGDGLYITYVSASGSDDNLGTFYKPVKTLAKGAGLASGRGDDLYVSAGTYSLADALFADGVNIYGGYKSDFSGRNVHSSDPAYKTTLINPDKSVTLRIEDFAGTFILDGFFITSDSKDEGVGGMLPDTDDYGCNQAAVYIVNSNLILSNNVISGSDAADRPCGVLLGTGAEVRLNANKIDGGGSDKAVSSTALSIVEADPVVTNNILIAGKGEHAASLRMTASSPVIVNNTLDAASNAAVPKTSYGILFDGGSPKVVNNLVYTNRAADQYVLACRGKDLSDAEIKNNLLTTFPQTGTNSILIDCDGDIRLTSDFIASPSFDLDGAAAADNVTFSGVLGQLIDGQYNLAGTSGVDAGMDADDDEYGDVTSDYNGKLRPANGRFDIGAVEK